MRLFLLAGLPGLLFTTGAVLPANPLVVPGKSLGNIRLGSAVDSLTWMGPADYGDAAMQKAWSTWYAKPGKPGVARYQIDLYTSGVGPELHKQVRLIRATSPWFRTAGGVRVGTPLARLKTACGPLKLAATYRPAPGAALRYLYDNARAGMAFETAGPAATSRCVAVIVHLPGQGVASTYLSLTDYLQAAGQQVRKP